MPFICSALLEEVVDILTKRFEATIKIKNTVFLSEPERRNVLVRMTLESPSSEVPKTFIFKQSLPEKSSQNDKEALGRFARDWVGLEFLSSLHSDTAPKVYGGSEKYRFILLEDLGNVHVSLVDSLMGKDRNAAIEALTRFMISLGKLHGCAHGSVDHYQKLLKKLNPNKNRWQDELENMLPKMKNLLNQFDIPWTDECQQEMEHVFQTCKEPGPFTTLVHGDICPDNVFDDPQNKRMHIIDFEWSFVENALLDGTYLRMSNPTCWCVKALPQDVIESLEDQYRQELTKYIPAAADDKLYNDSYVSACAYWSLWRVASLEDILETEVDTQDSKFPVPPLWKPEYNIRRPRNLARLQAFIDVSKKFNLLPNLRKMTELIMAELKHRWPDVEPLDLYPAFKESSEI